MEDATSYLKRGRKLAELSLDDLKSRCGAELKQIIDNYGRDAKWEGLADVVSEFKLRNLDGIPDDARVSELIEPLCTLQTERQADAFARDPETFDQSMADLDRTDCSPPKNQKN